MKTQILKTGTSKAILLAMMIAFAAPAANAQRRAASQNEKSKKVEQAAKRSANKTASAHDRYRNTGKQKAEGTQRRETTAIKKDRQHGHQNENYANHGNRNWNKHKDRYRYDRHAGIQVHVNPPVFVDWNVYAHKHRHISFRRVPRKAIWVHLDNEIFLVHRGRFYRPSPAGFYKVKPPRYINNLPEGCNQLWVNGKKFFDFHGILFLDTPLGFKIIAS